VGLISNTELGYLNNVSSNIQTQLDGKQATLGDDDITPSMVLSTGQTDEYCLSYEATGTTWEWKDCSGGSGGDNISVDGGAVVDPDFVSTGDIDFVNTTNTITANINSGSIVNADINASAAIGYSKLSLTGSILETDLSTDVVATDGDFLQYDSTGTNFTWRDAGEVRSDLGLVIGTNVQAYDADLTTYAGITPSANVQSLLGAADYAAMRSQLTLVVGTNVQAYDADLTTYAGITPSANVQSYLAAADYSAMRTLLSLGSLATLSTINNSNWSGTDLSVANGGTGLSTFGGTNHALYTTAADTLASEAAYTYNSTTNTLAADNLTLATTLSFSGVGALNGVDSVDSTTITTIENAFDTVSAALETAIEAAIDTLSNLTLTGTIDAGGATSFEIPNGTGPTVDTLGEIALDTTDNQFLVATGTSARAIPTITKLWGGTLASTSIDFASGGRIALPPHRDGVVITEVHCFVDGGTSKVINMDTMAGGAQLDSLTCATTLTSDTAQSANNSLSAGALMALEFGATTGTVDYVTFSVWGYIKPE
jgi:hypothetical protein